MVEQGKELALIDTKVIEDFIFSTETKLTPAQKKLFIALSVRNQLDPFKREIHAVTYMMNGKPELSVVTGYEVYLKRAERSGQLDGWQCWTEGDGPKLKAKIKITRKDRKEPFEWEVDFAEYDLGRALWKTKPRTMLKKVAMAQGFRLAFPEELGGMPYTADEIDLHGKEVIEAELGKGVDEPPPKPEQKTQKAEETKAKNMELPFGESEKTLNSIGTEMSKCKTPEELKVWWQAHMEKPDSDYRVGLSKENFKKLSMYKDVLKNQLKEAPNAGTEN